MRWLFGLLVLVFRGDQVKDAELLVLRHENAVLRRTAGRVRYEPSDRAWFAALAPFIPRRQRAGTSRDTRVTTGLAPCASRTEVRHDHPPPDRPPADRAEHRPGSRPPGEGEPAVGHRRIHGELTKLYAGGLGVQELPPHRA
jgi:putative transposase